jgi:RNA polymerase primary sigma factor/RNA polymerase nonessential primary-like sigma factor
VAWVARRYRASGVPRDDLVSEGMIGLLTAVDRFDTTRGVRFGTYARWWVLDAMRNCVLRQSRVVRLPANVVKELGKLDRELDADGAPRGEPAPRSVIDRVAQRLQRSGDHVERLLTLREPALSLDGEDAAKVAEDPHTAVASPEAVAIVSELREKMFSLMGTLSAREQLVLTARYGLDTGEPSTLEAVAERLGLTAERIRQLQRDALAKLRRSFIEQGLIELAADDGGQGEGA